MKLDNKTKEKIDSYFESLSPEELEKILYKFGIKTMNKLTYSQKIVREFINWLKSKRMYTEFVQEFDAQFSIGEVSEKQFEKILLETASSIYNLMLVINYDKTKQGHGYWWELSYEWDDYLDNYETSLNNIRLILTHRSTNKKLVIECKDINVNTHAHSFTIDFVKGSNYYKHQTSVIDFCKENNLKATYVHPNGVYFNSQDVKVTVEDNLFD